MSDGRNELNDPRHWDYSNSAQRVQIAERITGMLDALVFNTPATDEHRAIAAAYINARTHIEEALRLSRGK
jgi:hypothetical protein